MNEPRSGHSLVFDDKRKVVFAVGGFINGNVSRSVEVYNIEHQQWYKISDLNVERTQPTVFCYKDNVYVMGGLSTN